MTSSTNRAVGIWDNRCPLELNADSWSLSSLQRGSLPKGLDTCTPEYGKVHVKQHQKLQKSLLKHADTEDRQRGKGAGVRETQGAELSSREQRHGRALAAPPQALEAQTGRSTVSRRLGIHTEQKLKMLSEEMSRFLLQTGFTLITVTSCVQKASKGSLDYFSIKLWILIFSS